MYRRMPVLDKWIYDHKIDQRTMRAAWAALAAGYALCPTCQGRGWFPAVGNCIRCEGYGCIEKEAPEGFGDLSSGSESA